LEIDNVDLEENNDDLENDNQKDDDNNQEDGDNLEAVLQIRIGFISDPEPGSAYVSIRIQIPKEVKVRKKGIKSIKVPVFKITGIP